MRERPHTNRLDEIVGGKYRIVRFLAEGGMGVVYEAQHTVVKRRFAVKFLHADLADRREILTRFQREAQAAGALESENVAAAIDFGVASDGTPFIVMEYLVGESLESLLAREGQLSVGRATDLVLQACRGIQAAHASSIVHRDLKPPNLFVCRRDDGTDLVKVLDFGVAKLQAVDDKSAATRTGTVLGTVSYMSPEQARGDRVVDHRTDVYSLGAILYELLSGENPHPGASPNAVLYHISTQPAVPLDSVVPDLPATVVELVMRALLSDPEARYASAEELGRALLPLSRREVWPEPKKEDSAAPPVEPSSTLLAPGAFSHASAASPASVANVAGAAASLAVSSIDAKAVLRPAGRSRTFLVTLGVGGAVAALLVAIGTSRRAQDPPQLVASTSPSGLPSIVATAPLPAATASLGIATAPLPVATAPLAAASSADALRVATAASVALPSAAPSSTLPTPEGVGRADGRSRGRPSEPRTLTPGHDPAIAASSKPAGEPRATPVTFDRQNPYN